MTSTYESPLHPTTLRNVLARLADAESASRQANTAMDFIEMIPADANKIISMDHIRDVAHIIQAGLVSGHKREEWENNKFHLLVELEDAGLIPKRTKFLSMAESDLAWQRLLQKESSPSRRATYLTDVVANPETLPSIVLDAGTELAKTLWDNLGTTFATRYDVISWPVLNRAYLEIQTANARFDNKPDGHTERAQVEATIGDLYHWDGNGSAPNHRPGQHEFSAAEIPVDLIGLSRSPGSLKNSYPLNPT